jgi:hypothetical protein
MGGGWLPQLLGGEIGDGSRTPFCLALSQQNQPNPESAKYEDVKTVAYFVAKYVRE